MSRIRSCLVAVFAAMLLLLSFGNLAGCADSKVKTSTRITGSTNCCCQWSSDNTPLHSVTLRVRVDGQGDAVPEDKPSGTIQFKNQNSVLGTVAVVPGEEAMAELEIPVGTCTITACYGGDRYYARSQSAGLELELGNPTRTTLMSYPNPAYSGELVTFAVTVTAAAGTGLPTGTVTLWEDYDPQGGQDYIERMVTVTIASGQASYSTPGLSAGVHKIYATYDGDADFHGSTSTIHSESGTSGYLVQTVK